MSDGAEPRWAFLLDVREEHLIGERAQRVFEVLPLFESVDSVPMEIFRTIDQHNDLHNDLRFEGRGKRSPRAIATKRNLGLEEQAETTGEGSWAQQILITNTRLTRRDDWEDNEAGKNRHTFKEGATPNAVHTGRYGHVRNATPKMRQQRQSF